MSAVPKKAAAAPEVYANAEVTQMVERFLVREARLLDHERWDDWMALMTEDVHYWMPVPENRRRSDRTPTYRHGAGAMFDDNLRDLTRRVTRFKQPSAWAEDPATRHVHVVGGIEVFETERPDEFLVHSTFVNYRSRVERDNDHLVGRREDIVRLVDGECRLARRAIYITQAVFMAKNLNTFL